MYTLHTEASFDSAHFLKDYQGKCRNIHGHRWKVRIEISGESLQKEGSCRGMILDFSEIKTELREITEYFDHALIIEKNSLKKSLLNALQEEQFRIIEVEFRPTAEHFAKFFYEHFQKKGFPISQALVYETPSNCAAYSKDVISYAEV